MTAGSLRAFRCGAQTPLENAPRGNSLLPQDRRKNDWYARSDVACVRNHNCLAVQFAVRVEKLPQCGFLDHEALA